MYIDSSLLTAGALRLVQLLLNPFIMAGLQSVAGPNNGQPLAPMAPLQAMQLQQPPRQLGQFSASGSGSADLVSQLLSLSSAGAAAGAGGLGTMPSSPGMTMAAMQPMPPMQYPPWLFAQPLPAVPAAPNGPVYVPPSALASAPTATPAFSQQGQASTPSSSSLAGGALSILEQAIAPYTNNNNINNNVASETAAINGVTDETAAPFPMHTLLSVLSSLGAGIRVVVVNFMASFAVMGAAQLVRIVVQNLPIILNLLGLSRASMARVIVDGVTRAQCLEHAACVMGRHANTYQTTPDVLRWLRSPDPAAPEHPVWKAFRSAAEGSIARCDTFAC